MNNPKQIRAQLPLGVVLVLTAIGFAFFSVDAAERPTARAMRVEDGVITIDGLDNDWKALGPVFDQARTTASGTSHLTFAFTSRGSYSGPDDLSLTSWLASDNGNLYILADVHDQLLINDAEAANCFAGDDFEVFIDANPPEARFAKKLNGNVRQLVFVPGFVNPRFPKTFVWKSDRNPGVLAVSHLRPWGYTIEIKIPKALFPNWAAHPEMNSIGFDIGMNDADAPGVDCVHPALKQALFLLHPAPHFQSAEQLGQLQMDAAPGKSQMIPVSTPKVAMSTADILAALQEFPAKNPELIAQAVLDAMPGDDAARIAGVAVNNASPVVRKAGLLVLAKCSELPVPLEMMLNLLDPKAAPNRPVVDIDSRVYALIALAERHALPIQAWAGYYARISNPTLRLTFIWAMGRNGDAAAVPVLNHLLYDSNERVRMMAVIALTNLGDHSSLKELQEMAEYDPHNYGRKQAEEAIKQLQKHP